MPKKSPRPRRDPHANDEWATWAILVASIIGLGVVMMFTFSFQVRITTLPQPPATAASSTSPSGGSTGN